MRSSRSGPRIKLFSLEPRSTRQSQDVEVLVFPAHEIFGIASLAFFGNLLATHPEVHCVMAPPDARILHDGIPAIDAAGSLFRPSIVNLLSTGLMSSLSVCL